MSQASPILTLTRRIRAVAGSSRCAIPTSAPRRACPTPIEFSRNVLSSSKIFKTKDVVVRNGKEGAAKGSQCRWLRGKQRALGGLEGFSRYLLLEIYQLTSEIIPLVRKHLGSLAGLDGGRLPRSAGRSLLRPLSSTSNALRRTYWNEHIAAGVEEL